MEWYYILYVAIGYVIYHTCGLVNYFFGSSGRPEPIEIVNPPHIIEDQVVPLQEFRRLEPKGE